MPHNSTRLPPLPPTLVQSLYSVIGNRSLWPEALRQLCEWLPMPYCSIITLQFEPLAATRFLVWGMPERDLRDYFQRLVHKDPWMTSRSPAGIAEGMVANSADVCPDDLLEASEAYPLLRKHNLHYGASSILLANERMTCMFSVLRSKASGRLTPGEMSRVSALTWHLHRVLRIQEELDRSMAQADVLQPLFEKATLGLVLVDEDGRILLANERARALMVPNGVLVNERGKIRASLGRQRALMGALRACFNASQAQGAVLLGSDASPIRMTVSQVRVSGGRILALLHLLDPNSPPVLAPDLLRRLFPFSNAEAQVASMLCEGVSVAEAAKRLHVSPHTVRSHLKNLFLKTGTHQQSGLVGSILRLHPLIAASQ